MERRHRLDGENLRMTELPSSQRRRRKTVLCVHAIVAVRFVVRRVGGWGSRIFAATETIPWWQPNGVNAMKLFTILDVTGKVFVFVCVLLGFFAGCQRVE